MEAKKNYPLLRKAALAIAYDNGFINRTCTESKWMGQVDAYIATENEKALTESEAILAQLSESELNEVACGDVDEAGALLMAKKFDCIQVNTLEAILDGVFNL
jgi:hypothetical protein